MTNLKQILSPDEMRLARHVVDGRLDLKDDAAEDLYTKLFDHFSSSGEMPYKTQTARSGDPYKWITDKLSKKLGVTQ